MASSRTEPQPGTSLFGNIIKLSTLYSCALIAQRMASLILLPINTRFLSPTDYGVLDLLEQISIIISILLGGSYGASLGYFYFENNDPESRRRVIGTAFLGAIFLGVVAGLVGSLFPGFLSWAAFTTPAYAPYVRVALISLPFSFILEAEFSTLRVENRGIAYALCSVLRVVLTIIATILFVAVMRLHIWGVLFSSLTAMAVVAVVLGIYQLRLTPPAFSFALFLRMWRFALPLGFSGAAMFLIHFGDRFLLPRYRPLSELGIYGLAYKLGMMLSFVYSSFHNYWDAQIYDIMKREDANAVFGRVFTYMMSVISFCALGLVVGAKPIFRNLTAPGFYGAAALVPLIVAAYYLRSIGDFFRCLFFAANKPAWDAMCNGAGAVVCLAGYFLLIPRYGMWGAATATAITFLFIGVISVAVSYRLYKFRLETGRLVKLIGTLGVLCGIYYLVPVSERFLQIGWAILLLGSFPALLLALGFPTAGEVRRVQGLAGRYLPLGRWMPQSR